MTASATSRSLCPLATVWNTTTGFAPNAANANARRPGHSPSTTHAIAPQTASDAMTASTRYAATTSTGSRNPRDRKLESVVHAGP